MLQRRNENSLPLPAVLDSQDLFAGLLKTGRCLELAWLPGEVVIGNTNLSSFHFTFSSSVPLPKPEAGQKKKRNQKRKRQRKGKREKKADSGG